MDTVPTLPPMTVTQPRMGPRSCTLAGISSKPRAGKGVRAHGPSSLAIDTIGTSWHGRVGLNPDIHLGYGDDGPSQRHLTEGRLSLAGLNNPGSDVKRASLQLNPVSRGLSREGVKRITGSLDNLSNLGNPSNLCNVGAKGLTRTLSNLSMNSLGIVNDMEVRLQANYWYINILLYWLLCQVILIYYI